MIHRILKSSKSYLSTLFSKGYIFFRSLSKIFSKRTVAALLLMTMVSLLLQFQNCANSDFETAQISSDPTSKNRSITISSPLSNNSSGVKVGAIRWDNWYGKIQHEGRQVERSLSPTQYQQHAPFCSRIVDTQRSEIRDCGSTRTTTVVENFCSAPGVIDQEIEYAQRAGIDYWAFVAYDEGSALSLGLNQYLQSNNKHRVNFSIISDVPKWTPQTDQALSLRFINYMKMSNYQKVLNNRPLFFLGFINQEDLNLKYGSIANFGAAISRFKQAAENAGLATPYIVIMDPDIALAQREYVNQIGADAISTYSVGIENGSYQDLTNMAKTYWSIAKGMV